MAGYSQDRSVVPLSQLTPFQSPDGSAFLSHKMGAEILVQK